MTHSTLNETMRMTTTTQVESEVSGKFFWQSFVSGATAGLPSSAAAECPSTISIRQNHESAGSVRSTGRCNNAGEAGRLSRRPHRTAGQASSGTRVVPRSCRLGWTKVFGWLCCALSLSFFSGCAQLNVTWDDMIPWNDSDKEIQQPSRITVVWTDSVMSRPGEPSQRGFGGRLMFYGNLSEDSIKVDGQLVVYMFDETDRDSENCVPDRRVIITAKQFTNHYSKSSVGHSYSVWAPWAEVGGYRKQISLVARFEPLEGASIMSELTRQVLPGPSPPEVPKPQATPRIGSVPAAQIQPVAYASPPVASAATNGIFPAVQPGAPAPRMQTTTFTIPPSSSAAIAPRAVDGSTTWIVPPAQQRFSPHSQPTRMPSSPINAVVPPAAQTYAQNNLAAGINVTPEPGQIIDQRRAWETYRQGGWEAYRSLRQAEALQDPARPRSSVRSAPRTHQLPAASIAPPRHVRAPMRPHPGGWPSGPASSPARAPWAQQNAAATVHPRAVR